MHPCVFCWSIQSWSLSTWGRGLALRGTEGMMALWMDERWMETSPNLSPGRETRLPLRVKGEGEGPRLCFSFDQLDIGKVFVGSAHSYEVRWRRLHWVSAQHFRG